MADPKQLSLAQILASLYQVAGDLRCHHSRIANQGSNDEPWKSHIFCEPLGQRLSHAINRVQSGIESPGCLLERFILHGDSRPLTPLVLPSSLLKEVITKYGTLYREYIDQLHSPATGTKPSNNGWIFRWYAEWLAEVQGMTDKFNWDWCVPGSNTEKALFQGGVPAIRPVVAGPPDHEGSKYSQPLPTTGPTSTMNTAVPKTQASIVSKSKAVRPRIPGVQPDQAKVQKQPASLLAGTFDFRAPISMNTHAPVNKSQPEPQPASAKKVAPLFVIPPPLTQTLKPTSP